MDTGRGSHSTQMKKADRSWEEIHAAFNNKSESIFISSKYGTAFSKSFVVHNALHNANARRRPSYALTGSSFPRGPIALLNALIQRAYQQILHLSFFSIQKMKS